MALKSPYNPDDQIYEHLVQSSDLAIQSSQSYIYALSFWDSSQTSGPEGDLGSLHWGLNGRVPLPIHWPTIAEFIYYHQAAPCGMYGRNVFQILQKKEYPPRTSSAMGSMSIPVLRSISQPKAGGCQASLGYIPLTE